MAILEHRELLVVATVILLVSVTQANDVTTASTSDGNITTTEVPKTPLNVQIVERFLQGVSLTWDPPEDGQVKSYKLQTNKDDSQDIILTPELDSLQEEYVVDHLVIDSAYNVCVIATVTGNSNGQNTIVDCKPFETLPYMRMDSIIALCGALGYILLMILIGILCWWCTKRRAEREEDEEELEPEEPEKIQPDIYKPAYVAPPADSPIRSSIEDNPDIPYITPPLAQLKKEREQANAKV